MTCFILIRTPKKINSDLQEENMTLPYDMARCEAKKCEQRNKCLRFTSPWRPVGYQVVRDFEAFLIPANGCDYFIGDENESKKDRPGNK